MSNKDNNDKKPDWIKGRARGNWIILGLLVLFVVAWYGYFLINAAMKAGQ